MRNAILTTSLVIAVIMFVLQFPTDTLLSPARSLGLVLQSQASYGEHVAVVIDKVVKNIHARIPNAEITHADVLTIMCMESAGLLGRRQTITSGAGARGVTQVMPATLRYYASSHVGGFYLPNRPDLLYDDLRYSIEAGALIYNHHLMNYVPRYGNTRGRTKAAIAYNGGPGRVNSRSLPRETYNYAYRKLPNCFNKIIRGQSPVNTSIWKSMMAKTVQITGGRLLGRVNGVASAIPSINTAPRLVDKITASNNQWWQSSAGRRVAQSQLLAPGGYNNSTNSVDDSRTRKVNWLKSLFNNSVARSTNGNDIKKHNTSQSTNKNISKYPKAKISCQRRKELVRVKWTCPTGTTISRGTATKGVEFDTGGANVGVVVFKNIDKSEYILQCLKGHKLYARSRCSI